MSKKLLDALEGLKAERSHDEADPPAPLIQLVPDWELCARHTPLPKALIDGLLNRGEVSMLAADSKEGKSWAALQMAKCVGAGIDFLDHRTEQRVAVFVNTELQDAQWEERARKQNEALGIDSTQVYHASTRGRGLTIKNVIVEIRRAIDKAGLGPVDLIVVDPYYTLTAGLGENEAGDVAQVMLDFQKMAEELNAAILITHHFTKGDSAAKSQLDRASGSGVFARSVDNFYTITKDGEKRVFEVTRRNGASPVPLEVVLEFPIWRVIGEAEPVRKQTGASVKYTAESVVAKFPDGGATMHWGDFVKAGIPRSSLSDALKRAEDAGYIDKCGDGYILTREGMEVWSSA